MNELNFDDSGEIVPACDFDFASLDDDDLRDGKREIVTRAAVLQGLITAREEGFRAGLDAALPEAKRQVVRELVSGHKEPSAALSRVAGAAVKLGLMPVQDAARWAGKTVRMIRHVAARMAL